MTHHHYQVDIPYASQNFMSLPQYVPGRVNTDDFVYFKWPRSLNPQQYSVLVEPNDTAGGSFRTLGTLSDAVGLPVVYFNAESMIGVVPTNNGQLPAFWSRLNRGSTYVIPDVGKQPGVFSMDRHGVLTAAVPNYIVS